MLHSVVRKTRCSDPIVYVEGRRRKVTAVSLTEVSCHKEDVPAKLDKVLVTTTQLHLLDWDIKQRNISVCVCDCVWLSVINTTLMTWVNIPLLDQWQWQRQSLSEISPQWRRTGRTLPREPRTLQQNNSQFRGAVAAVFLSSSYRDDSGDCLQKILTSWRWWCSLEILVLASVYSSFPNTAPPAYNSRDGEKSSLTLQSTDLFNFQNLIENLRLLQYNIHCKIRIITINIDKVAPQTGTDRLWWWQNSWRN